MIHALHQNRQGFSLIELMIVVAIIGMLASIAVPSYTRARKRGQAVRVLEDLKTLDSALDNWAIEHNKSPGDIATLSDLQAYIRVGTILRQGVDPLGNSYQASFSVDSLPRVPTLTYNVLSDVAPAMFWSPYR